MPGPKTNERPGTRAVHRHARVAPNKVREVLDLIRGANVPDATDILRFCERDAALLVGKVLASAVANAGNNDGQDADELYVAACFADEGTTIKRWRPRARGRATRIRKRTSHITVIVSRLPEERLARLQARRQAEQVVRRARRVAAARRSADAAGAGRGRLGRRRAGAADRGAVAGGGLDAAVAEAAAEAVEHATEAPATDLGIPRTAVQAAGEDVDADESVTGDHEAGPEDEVGAEEAPPEVAEAVEDAGTHGAGRDAAHEPEGE
jgi:large subunit ribosomal protein L22